MTTNKAFDAFTEVEDELRVEVFRQSYIGAFNSWAKLAELLVEEVDLLDGVPDKMVRSFDYDRTEVIYV
ncbi:antirestriction protein [Xanthomonas sacchari]|uniref:hypothetical protein n=1 Tax=unclassified Xanthomonas TaxID=2643310 RepID=UPI0003741247|nr:MULTISPECIES: hypothetical protein [unclassified Xanthomonas]KAB7765722.1 antirestriction protein [Xanthomonas sp. LMG 12462]